MRHRDLADLWVNDKLEREAAFVDAAEARWRVKEWLIAGTRQDHVFAMRPDFERKDNVAMNWKNCLRIFPLLSEADLDVAAAALVAEG